MPLLTRSSMQVLYDSVRKVSNLLTMLPNLKPTDGWCLDAPTGWLHRKISKQSSVSPIGALYGHSSYVALLLTSIWPF